MRFFFLLLFSATALSDITSQCDLDLECLVEVPGSQCADGTPSFITLTRRQNAKHLLVYLKGGGACWDAESCSDGLARPLTRVEAPTEWNSGNGIHQKGSGSPFGENYNIVTIPYCTGDAFTGDNVINYSDRKYRSTIRHHGYQNVVKSLEVAQRLVSTPEKAVLLGCSAGGIGAFFHFNNFRKTFPLSKRYVISDAGLPFKPPHIYSEQYAMVMQNWGTQKHLDQEGLRKGQIRDFGDLIRYNTVTHPDTRFGFISAYRDGVMTFFGIAVGSPVGMRIVRDNIIDIANNSVGQNSPHARVFFTETNTHCHTPKALANQTSLGVTLKSWLSDMVGDNDWHSVRPDLVHDVKTADEMEIPTSFPYYP